MESRKLADRMLKKLFGGGKKKDEEPQHQGGGGKSKGYPGSDWKRQQAGGGGNAGYPGAAFVQQQAPPPPYYPQGQDAAPPPPYYPQQQQPGGAPPPPYPGPAYVPNPTSAATAAPVPYQQQPPGGVVSSSLYPSVPALAVPSPPPHHHRPGGSAPSSSSSPYYGGGGGQVPAPQPSGASYYQPVPLDGIMQLPPAQAPPDLPPPYLMGTATTASSSNAAPLPPPQVAPYLPPSSAPPMPQYQQQQQGSSVYAPVDAASSSSSSLPAPSAPDLPPGYSYFDPAHTVSMSSSCQGRRRALFIGICYYGSENQLQGCVNDCRMLLGFLQSTYGLRQEDTRVLTDDPNFSEGEPTRRNILSSLQWLVEGARPGDSLFLHYSGHGGRTRDTSGDEADGYDETILPLDFKRAGEILDDDLHRILVRPLARGVRLTAVFDSCHSGSVLDLPYSYKVDGSLEIVQIDNTARAMESLFQAGAAYLMGNKTGALMAAIQGVGALMGPGENKAARERAERENRSDADVIQFGGCRDDQTSADARINGRASGAMSYAFVEALKRDPHQPYTALLKNMRKILMGSYSQVPQVSTSHKMDLRANFQI